MSATAGDLVVRVLPDVSGIDKTFDYRVPARFVPLVRPGTLVRMDLNGRRVAGWVLELDPEVPPGVDLREITKVSSAGPPLDILELARWTAHRWAGRVASVVKVAMPDRMVTAYPAPSVDPVRSLPVRSTTTSELVSLALDQPGVTVVQLPPATDLGDVAITAVSRGDVVLVAPDLSLARHLGTVTRRAGARIGLAGRDFAQVAAGGSVVGARSAVFSPVRDLAAVVVFDEHDESLQEERNPTWHAREVAIERARRAGVPCVLVSPVPSLAARAAASRVLQPSRTVERQGWPLLSVVDQRDPEARRLGLFSEAFTRLVRSDRRIVCVLNRKGRSPMLACSTCGDLARTDDGEHLMADIDGELVHVPTGERRPLVCASCGGTRLKRLRLGVSRAREELISLVGEEVGEITAEADSEEIERHRVVIGTEAALHRVPGADAVAFLDFDQELLAPRYRAAEEAMALLARAARIVADPHGRSSRSAPSGQRANGQILVQTRSPDHRVLRAAQAADPLRFAVAEAEQRRMLDLPPFSALAEVSGAGAEALLEPLRDLDEVEVIGPRDDGRSLVRAADWDQLADVLGSLSRPKARVRVAVDPPRA